MPVIFTAKAADMVWGTLQSALSGKRVVERSSPWSSALGEQMTSPRITLWQDPEAGPFSCPFDDEGTPTQRLVFIEQGVVTLFYCDRTVGRRLGGGSTGNGFRPGLGSYPTPSLYNMLVQPGTQSLVELVARVDNGILVDQILGGGAGISGDFSVNVDLGYRIYRGELVGRIKDTMVAGNVYTALKDNVELGCDADWNGSCYTPSVRLDGLSITSS
jgi:PmbA protein